MAKYNNYNRQTSGNDRTRGNNSSNKSWLGATVFLIVAVVLAIVIAAGSAGFKNWNAALWFNGWGSNKPVASLPDDNGNSNSVVGDYTILTPEEGNGISLMSAVIAPDEYEDYGISTQAETAYEITATPNVSGVTDFTWTINWKNASSTWAKGKSITTYLNLTVAENNPLKAVVSIKGAFGEQAIINCTYNFNSNIKATSTVDYIKHITNLQVTGFHPEWVNDSSMSIVLSATYGIGTVQGTLTACYGSLELSDSAFSYLQSSQYYNSWVSSFNGTVQLVKNTADGIKGKWDFLRGVLEDEEFEPRTEHFIKRTTGSGSNSNYYTAMFYTLATETSNQIRACVDYTYTFGSTVYENSTVYSSYGSLDPNLFRGPLTSLNNVNVSNGALYFY